MIEETTWEAFRDASYYDMYAVRPVGERRGGHCFHLVDKDEAEGLLALLNALSRKNRAQFRHTGQFPAASD